MIRQGLHWIDRHTPQLKAGFLLLWAMTAIACGVSTLILLVMGKPVFTGVLDTFVSVMFFWFFRSLFLYLG
jgi:hypothetical protein